MGWRCWGDLPYITLERNKKYYYSHLLNSNEQKICDLIIEAIQKIKHSLVLRFFKITKEVFNKIFEVINLDFPELYYFDISRTHIIYIGFTIKIQFGYLYSNNAIISINKTIEKQLSILNNKIALERSKLNIEKMIHDYLVSEVTYVKAEIAEAKYHNIVGVFLDKTAVCEGYAKAFKYLCELNGVLCLVVAGNAINNISKLKEPHSWNIVKLGSYGCCHVDVTWDSCFYHSGVSHYVFFNQTDQDMMADHSWDRGKIPRCSVKFEKEITYCETAKQLEDAICRNIKDGILIFSLKVKKNFSGNEEVLAFTQKVIARHFELMIKRYNVSYIAARNQIEYRFEKF